MMKKCKYPKCNKKLVGNEKYICQSCKDKVKSGGKKVGTGALFVGGLILTAVLRAKSENSD